MFKPKLCFLILGVFLLASCGKTLDTNKFAGDWRGAINAGRSSIATALKISFKSNKYHGSFSVVGETPRGADIRKGDVFTLVNIVQSGNEISFIVSFKNGEITNDSLVFSLKLDGDQLKGYLKEKRPGSKVISVEFVK